MLLEMLFSFFFRVRGNHELCQDFAFWHHVNVKLDICIDDATSDNYPIARKCVSYHNQIDDIIKV